MAQYLCIWVGAYWFSATLISKWQPGGHIGFFGFWTLSLVWLWISTPNFSGTVLIYMARSLLIFSGVNFKMAAWQPYWTFWFPDSNFSLALNMKSKFQWLNNCVYESEPIDFQLPHFYPRPVLAFGYCRWLRLSVCVSVCVVTTCLSVQ